MPWSKQEHHTLLNDGQESMEEDHRATSSPGRKGKQNKRNELMTIVGMIPLESPRFICPLL
jgi:hypothetical protein